MVSPAEPLPRADVAAERQVLGAVLTRPAVLDELRLTLTVDDFYRPGHALIWHAALALADRGVHPDAAAVFGELRRAGDLERAGGGNYLHDLVADSVTTVNAAWHATRIRDTARLRSLGEHAQRMLQAVQENPDTELTLDAIARHLVDAEAVLEDTGTTRVADVQSWDEFIDTRSAGAQWIVPGLIRRHDTIMILGAGGAGKSSLSRQVAMCLAAGLHPFTQKPITPVRTLLIDLENAPDQVAEEAADLRAGVRRIGGNTQDRGWIWPHPQGFNLRQHPDAALLERVIAQTRPDVVCMGSLYNAYRRGNSDWDAAAEDVQTVLKKLRTRYSLGLWLEHHMPRKEGTGHTGTPFGGTAWERWPTHGRVLRRVSDRAPLFELAATFRGDRGPRDLPAGLQRGGRLPWTAIEQEELDLIRATLQ